MDTCDPFLVPSPSEADLSVEGRAGEGGVSSLEGFPSAGASARFLEARLEGWRRLECAEPPGLALAGLPQALGVISLQVWDIVVEMCERGEIVPSSTAVYTH